MNVDQLSRCYAGLATEGPLQFTHTVRPRRANRRRRAIAKKESMHAHPHHQMTLRQTANLDFDGVTDHDTEILPVSSIDTRISHTCECVAMTGNQNLSCRKNGENSVALVSTEITPVTICHLEMDSQVKGRKQLALGDLSEGVTVKQTVQILSDVDLDVERVERVEYEGNNFDRILLDETDNGKEETPRNWRRRKKVDLTMEETGKTEEVDWEGRDEREITDVWGINMHFSEIAKIEELNLEKENLDLKKENLDLEKEEEELDLEEEELELEDVDRRIWTRPKKLRRSENIIKV
ncbi:MAG: hypothetical protein GY820_45435 [Gammaproteobacteria bacterium]|nr:hypothetical protein [Gammaproteobacteria bacterium]